VTPKLIKIYETKPIKWQYSQKKNIACYVSSKAVRGFKRLT